VKILTPKNFPGYEIWRHLSKF